MDGKPKCMGRGRSFLSGVVEVTPLLLGVIPFGVICGALCADAGMPEWGASGLSVVIFAGASQLVAVKLLSEQSETWVVILATLVVNLRMLMYSASIAPHLKDSRIGTRAALAYLMTDQAYAVSYNRYLDTEKQPVDRAFFYLGTGVLMWVSFNLSTILGVYVGAFIPEELGLDFAIPLTFLALVVPRISDRPSLLAMVVGGVVATLSNELPYNMGLILGALSGIAVALAWERRLLHD